MGILDELKKELENNKKAYAENDVLDTLRYMAAGIKQSIPKCFDGSPPPAFTLNKKQDFFITYGIDPSHENNNGCDHNYKLYNGFVENYYFCEKCDHKKPYNED